MCVNIYIRNEILRADKLTPRVWFAITGGDSQAVKSWMTTMDSTGNPARKLGVVCSNASNLIDGFEMDDFFQKCSW